MKQRTKQKACSSRLSQLSKIKQQPWSPQQQASLKQDKKHQEIIDQFVAESQPKALKMSPEKCKEIFDRQFEKYKSHQEKIKHLIQDKEEQEINSLQNFKASSKSTRLISGKYVPIQIRQQEILQKKKEKLEQHQKDQEEKKEQEIMQLTFHPQINKKSQDEFKDRDFIAAQKDWLEQHRQNLIKKRAQIEEDSAKELKTTPSINQKFKFHPQQSQQTYIHENVADRLYEKHE